MLFYFYTTRFVSTYSVSSFKNINLHDKELLLLYILLNADIIRFAD